MCSLSIYIQIHFEQQRRIWSKTNSDLSSTMTCCLTLLTACHPVQTGWNVFSGIITRWTLGKYWSRYTAVYLHNVVWGQTPVANCGTAVFGISALASIFQPSRMPLQLFLQYATYNAGIHMHSITWSDWPTLLRHYWTVLIDCYWWKNYSKMIDLTVEALSSGTAESIHFLCTLWCSVFPVATLHNSPHVTVEMRLGLQMVSYPFTTNSGVVVN